MPPEPAPGRTGTATILFTDLVGSTAQRAQLGEEAARRGASTSWHVQLDRYA